MRLAVLFSLFLAFFSLTAQDKIYFLNGKVKTGKILEIASDQIIIKINDNEQTISKYDILLIEFKNGTIELINAPTQNATYDPNLTSDQIDIRKQGSEKTNFASLNCLALYNADVSLFYEYLTKNKIIGLGVMGAYNFNLTTTLPNLFLANLHNTKKNYDLGGTINLYTDNLQEGTCIYFGVMAKYTDFSFDKVKRDSTTAGGVTSVNVSYSTTNGHQFSILFTGGTHSVLSDQFYLKTLAGLGAFKLTGDFKEEYNGVINGNLKTGSAPVNYNFLPKLYLGINIGFNF